MTPTLSEASALIVIVPATVEPDAVEVMATVGGVQSEPLLKIVTVTGLEVVVFPAASRARAVRVWAPLLAPVGGEGEEGGEVEGSGLGGGRASMKWTSATPTV